MTIYTPEIVKRNAAFAASGAFKGLPFPTNPAVRVIGCVDSRVDPGDVLGLPALVVSGLVYDVSSGLIEVVVPASMDQRHV